MSKNLFGFRRLSLVEQTAEALATAIKTGGIVDVFPGEVELSTRLKVSRVTLRRAIALLAHRDLLVTAKGKRTRVVPERHPRKASECAPVCFVICTSPGSHLVKLNALLDEVKATLTAEDVLWNEIFKSQLGKRQTEERLREIVSGRGRSCYVLLNSSRLVQQWFAKSGEPVIVMGSCHEGVNLPSIDLDQYAVGWHAGGQFVKNGHRNILFIEPEERSAGLDASKAGLQEYLGGVADTRVRVLRTRLDSFLSGFERALRGPEVPTAVLACRVEIALSVLGSAQRFGRHIPRDFSLIARDDHPVFEFMVPQITRYKSNLHAMARKTIRQIHALRRGEKLAAKTVLIAPEFFAGQTLRPR